MPNPKPPNPGSVMSDRALSRALLARQLLLRREPLAPIDAIDHLVGMQAQRPRDPYVGLWSRLEGFAPPALEALLTERHAARAPLLRTTLHLAAARDCLALRPLLQPIFERTQRGQFGKQLAGADLDVLVRAAGAILEREPRTFAELRAELGEPWSRYDPSAVAYSISYLLPLVQVPPRGLWNDTGQATWALTERWLGPRDDATTSAEEVVTRYLAAFGPASAADVQAWCGLTRLREVMDRLRPELVSFHDERGRELFDLPDAPRPDPDTPAPPRFLPVYDNALLAHADRARIVPDAFRESLATQTTDVGTVLVDGFVAAEWTVEAQRGSATLRIVPNGRLARADREAVAAEGEALLAFLAAGSDRRAVRFGRSGTVR